MSSFKKAIDTYTHNADAVLLFAFPLLLSAVLLMLFPYPTFTSLGGAFLRILNLYDLGFLGLVLTALAILASIAFIGFSISAVSLIVKESRVGNRIKYGLFAEAVKDYSFGISFFYFMVFLFLEGVQMLVYSLGASPLVFSAIAFLTYYAIFFVPYAMIIDDYSIGSALEGGWYVLRIKPLDPLKWFLIILAVNAALILLLNLVVPYGWAKAIVMMLNGLVITPFMVIYGAHLYIDKYPMTVK